MILHWYDGVDQYKEHKLCINNNLHQYECTLHDIDGSLPARSYVEITKDILQDVQNVEVLFSGGSDSELVLRTALHYKVKCKVITLKLLLDGCLINTSDLYYSENFCRENGLTQYFLELDVKKFFEENTHLHYLEPYYITEPHVATHFYMIEKCDYFPIMAGDYSWPQVNPQVLSPHRLAYNCYNKFMEDHNITGIGNFLNHSLELNLCLIQKHIDIVTKNNLHYDNVGKLKSEIYSSLGSFKPRLRSSGWEDFSTKAFNKNFYKLQLFKKLGVTKPTINWGSSVSTILKTDLNTNNKF